MICGIFGVRLNRSQRSQPPLAGRFAGLAVRNSLFVERGHERLRVVEAERSRDELRGVQHGAGRGELRNEGIEATPWVIFT